MTKRQKILASSILIVISFLVLIISQSSKIRLIINSNSIPNSKETVIRIADTTFKIPNNYFYSRIPTKDDKDFLIAIMHPEFKPLEKSPSQYFAEGRKFEDIRFLISDPKNILMTIDEIIERTKKRTGSTQYYGEQFKLHKWSSSPDDALDNEVYIYRENNKDVGYLMCTRDGAAPNPQCSGNFRKFGLNIRISFDKDFLVYWPDISDKGFNLIKSFMITGPHQNI